MDTDQALTYLIIMMLGFFAALGIIYQIICGLLRSLRGTMVGSRGLLAPQITAPVVASGNNQREKSSFSFLNLLLLVATLFLGYMAFGYGGQDDSASPPTITVKSKGAGEQPADKQDHQSPPRPTPPRPKKDDRTLLIDNSAFRTAPNTLNGAGLQLAALSMDHKVTSYAVRMANQGHRIRVFRNYKGHYCIAIVGFADRAEASRYKREYGLKATEVSIDRYPVRCFSNGTSVQKIRDQAS